MIKLYESYGCGGCRKTRAWLEKNNIPYVAVNFEHDPLEEQEIKFLFSLSEDVYDVLSKRALLVTNFKRNHGFEIEDLSFNQLLKFLHNHPQAMKRPLITDGKNLVSGYDEQELTVFLPKECKR